MNPTNHSNETIQPVKGNKTPFLPLLLAVAISGCGGGGNVVESSQVAQPLVAATLATSAFVQLATGASCANLRNRLFVIDQKQVFWDKVSTCADASYSQVLFGDKPETILCSTADSIAGPRTFCNDQQFKTLFDTIAKNLDKADLGLGTGHTVQQLTVPGGPSANLPFTSINARLYSGTAPANIVIKDAAAWAQFWAGAQAKPVIAPFPEPDFSSQMVLGVFFNTANNCSVSEVVKLSSNGQKLTVEYTDENRISAQSCDPGNTFASTPMNLVVLNRLDLPVEFVKVNTAQLAFAVLDVSSVSGVQTAQNLVIKDSAAWGALWATHTGSMTPAPVIPGVDFSKKMVIAVFLGQRANGCYDIDDLSVWRSAGKINVAHRDHVPGATSVCSMGIITPAYLIELDRSDEPVEFNAISAPL
jgi:hypothetical protein